MQNIKSVSVFADDRLVGFLAEEWSLLSILMNGYGPVSR